MQDQHVNSQIKGCKRCWKQRIYFCMHCERAYFIFTMPVIWTSTICNDHGTL